MFDDQQQNGPGIVAAVGNGIERQPEAGDQHRHRGLVGRLTRHQDEKRRQGAGVDDGVDLCAQSALRSFDGMTRALIPPLAVCQ